MIFLAEEKTVKNYIEKISILSKSTEDAKSERGHQRRAKLNTAAYALRECEWQSTLYSSYESRRNGAPGVEERLSAGGQRAPGAAVAGRRAKPAGLAP